MELETRTLTLEEIIDDITLIDGEFTHEDTTSICLEVPNDVYSDSISGENFRNAVYTIGRFITPDSFFFDLKGHCKFETLTTDKELVLKLLLESQLPIRVSDFDFESSFTRTRLFRLFLSANRPIPFSDCPTEEEHRIHIVKKEGKPLVIT
jgi:hypothetical protein